MSTEENKALIRRLIQEFINKGNTAVATELVAEDHVGLDPLLGKSKGERP